MKLALFFAMVTLSIPTWAIEVWTCTGKEDGIKSVTASIDYQNNSGQGSLVDNGSFTSDWTFPLSSKQVFDLPGLRLEGGSEPAHDTFSYAVQLLDLDKGVGKAVVTYYKSIDCVGEFRDVEILPCTIAH